MPILLPNLDDRRWTDLVNEGRALIPIYAPEWTDQNTHDPGITLIELLAWFAEMDIFSLNRVTDRAKLKFLSLVGIHPEPPRAASTLLGMSLTNGKPLALPQNIEFTALDPFLQPTVFQTIDAVTVQGAALAAIQVKDASGFHDVSSRWSRGISFGAFGDVPQTGTELYLGFNAALAAGAPFNLFFTFGSPRATPEERHRILKEAEVRGQDCAPSIPKCCGSSSSPVAATSTLPAAGARLVWELLVPSGAQTTWVPLAAADDTRAFTLDGGVFVTPSVAGAMLKLGQVETPLYYVRVRFAAGAYDAPPVVRSLAVNSVRAKQRQSAAQISWNIAVGVSTPTAPTGPTAIDLTLDASGQISTLSFPSDASLPQFKILTLTPPTPSAAGVLSIEAVLLGSADGTPYQQFTLPGAPVEQGSLALLTLENNAWRTWTLRPDFDSSSPGDAHFLLDPTAGLVTFGDGNQGRTAPAGARVIATYCATRADAGGLRAGLALKLNDSPHNRMLMKNFDDAAARLIARNALPSAGGTAAESLDLAIARAIRMLAQPQRAVTLADYEALAIQTPGTEVARAKAWADHHPSFPCFGAPGVIAVVILPNMPVTAPTPSRTMINAVSAYLNRRRIIGTRIEVTGPSYRVVAIQAQIQSTNGASKSAVQQRVVDALNAFLDPLTGGPDGTGWPFGRDVYRAEMMPVIDQVAGVDYIATLALLVDGCACDPQCGNVCLSPTELVSAGAHQIEVL